MVESAEEREFVKQARNWRHRFNVFATDASYPSTDPAIGTFLTALLYPQSPAQFGGIFGLIPQVSTGKSHNESCSM